jgi:hypothetical protein
VLHRLVHGQGKVEFRSGLHHPGLFLPAFVKSKVFRQLCDNGACTSSSYLTGIMQEVYLMVDQLEKKSQSRYEIDG